MPHFDEFGGDEWVCQAPGHRGNRIQNSRVKSEWRPDITGNQSAGNCCPTCVAGFGKDKMTHSDYRLATASDRNEKRFDKKRGLKPAELTTLPLAPPPSRRGFVDKAALRGLHPLDYADNPAELDFQRELQRMGVQNQPQPSVCPKCSGPLESHPGMVGEKILVCPEHGIVWEDAEGAIRNVY